MNEPDHDVNIADDGSDNSIGNEEEKSSSIDGSIPPLAPFVVSFSYLMILLDSEDHI